MHKDETEIFEWLRTEYPIEQEAVFSEFNIQEKLQNNSLLVLKYQGLYNQAKIDLEKMEDLAANLAGKLYDHYRFNYVENLTKQEIEKYYLPKDPKILKINKLIRKQKVKVEFFAMCYKSLEKMSWNMKSFSENMRKGIV